MTALGGPFLATLWDPMPAWKSGLIRRAILFPRGEISTLRLPRRYYHYLTRKRLKSRAISGPDPGRFKARRKQVDDQKGN